MREVGRRRRDRVGRERCERIVRRRWSGRVRRVGENDGCEAEGRYGGGATSIGGGERGDGGGRGRWGSEGDQRGGLGAWEGVGVRRIRWMLAEVQLILCRWRLGAATMWLEEKRLSRRRNSSSRSLKMRFNLNRVTEYNTTA